MSTKGKPETSLKPTAESNGVGLVARLAMDRGVDAKPLYDTLVKTIMPKEATNEHVMAFLLICDRYNLDPFVRHIFAFVGKGGGVVPVLSVDGWIALANQRPEFNGLEFQDHINDDGELTAITCRVHRKDRDFPATVTEYMSECARNTDPWNQWPARMLRHKATIQAIRLAFGISGLVDQDEYERAEGVTLGRASDRRRVSPVHVDALPEPSPEGSRPNGTKSRDEDFRKADLPREVLDMLDRAVGVNDPQRVDEIIADASSGADEEMKSRLLAAGDCAKAEIERKAKKQKELVK